VGGICCSKLWSELGGPSSVGHQKTASRAELKISSVSKKLQNIIKMAQPAKTTAIMKVPHGSISERVVVVGDPKRAEYVASLMQVCLMSKNSKFLVREIMSRQLGSDAALKPEKGQRSFRWSLCHTAPRSSLYLPAWIPILDSNLFKCPGCR
jgi:hypothetical protein